MKVGKVLVLGVISILGAAAIGCSAIASHHDAAVRWHSKSQEKSDPISGDWAGVFQIRGSTTPVALKLKLDGEKVTGTCESGHTGAGTVTKGAWVGENLSFTLEFATHEPIMLNAKLEEGKLIGDFVSHGIKGTWEAKKK